MSEDAGHFSYSLDPFATVCLGGNRKCISVGGVCNCSKLLCHVAKKARECPESEMNVDVRNKPAFSQIKEPCGTKPRENLPEYKTDTCEFARHPKNDKIAPLLLLILFLLIMFCYRVIQFNLNCYSVTLQCKAGNFHLPISSWK